MINPEELILLGALAPLAMLSVLITLALYMLAQDGEGVSPSSEDVGAPDSPGPPWHCWPHLQLQFW